MDASLIKKLKDMTNAGLMDCKRALEENNGDIDEAIKWLREKGISKAAKKQDRIAAEGLSNILVEGNKAVIVEVNCETDFVAKNEKFAAFIDRLCKTLINGNAKTMEEAEALVEEDGTTFIMNYWDSYSNSIFVKRTIQQEDFSVKRPDIGAL